MSGHSKWANIKRKKGENDKAKGVIFAKLSRIITLAVVEGGGIGDPASNFRLRLAIEKARSANMPKDNIERAIEKGTGSNSVNLKEVVYEAFLSHGVACMIQCTTDNPTRTFNEVRMTLESRGGKMGSQGSVSYLFQKCAVMEFDAATQKEDDVFAFAEALNAYDIDESGGKIIIYFPFESFGKAMRALGSLTPSLSEIEYRALTKVSVANKEEAQQVIHMAEGLEELDDVHLVFINLE